MRKEALPQAREALFFGFRRPSGPLREPLTSECDSTFGA